MGTLSSKRDDSELSSVQILVDEFHETVTGCFSLEINILKLRK